jgi:hypothetical protein
MYFIPSSFWTGRVLDEQDRRNRQPATKKGYLPSYDIEKGRHVALGANTNDARLSGDPVSFLEAAPRLALVGFCLLLAGSILPYRVGGGFFSQSVAFGIRGLRFPLSVDAVAGWIKFIGTFGLLIAAIFTRVRPSLRPLPIGIVMGVSVVQGLYFLWLLSIIPLGTPLWLGLAGCVLLLMAGTRSLRRFTSEP